MIHSRESISDKIKENSKRLEDWMQKQSAEAFEKGPEGKWTTGQHLDHLIKSVVPLNQAFLLPKFVYQMKFGKPNRPPRDFEALVARYNEKLTKGGQAPSRFVPPSVTLEQKQSLIAKFSKEYQKLANKTLKWKEADLDAYLLPHPLLGKVTVREMLFFTAHHIVHHLEILEDKYEK
ncbi:MAG: DinB family protein [Bacteroidetes bacterium]|nr:MAG: DinB family protein [Bacteroidota bacterium]